MKRYATTMLFAASLAVQPCHAQQAACDGREFRTFYAAFVDAAKANDKQKIADLIAFPVSDWSTEIKGDVQTAGVKDRAEFLRRYDVLFSKSMRAHVAGAKIETASDGRCFATWADGDADLAFGFAHTSAGYRVAEFLIGPM